jgi:hypothetical protein
VKFEVQDKIGCGSVADVYKGTYCMTDVAVKVYRLGASVSGSNRALFVCKPTHDRSGYGTEEIAKLKKEVVREVQALIKVRFPHVVRHRLMHSPPSQVRTVGPVVCLLR